MFGRKMKLSVRDDVQRDLLCSLSSMFVDCWLIGLALVDGGDRGRQEGGFLMRTKKMPRGGPAAAAGVVTSALFWSVSRGVRDFVH